jgi:class 3 adenylate cyclase/tetratricopeptide (TPR) repeat protein
VVVCSSCGQENPAGAKFCNECGAQLLERPPVLEERKVVSVLFCDLVGFTASSEAADPEDVRARRIRPYHARLRQEIERCGGTVEKFVGDAVMAVFGAPVAHEDDAERAVRAGLGILEAIGQLNDSDPGLDLKVRVGINTGEAVVALAASPELGESLVTGDVVNTANRIESAAPVGGVAVGEQTYRTTSHIFEYEPLVPVQVKGKSEPLALWEAKAVRIRFGSDVHEHTTPFVGRELEKPLLIGIYERTLQRRTVQLVTIVGEPGVGKSRMVAELFAYVEATPLPQITRWRQGRCLPYGEGITFWALGEIVKREAAILESDSAEVAAAKLNASIPPEEPERQWLIQRLAALVGVEAPPAERQEAFTAWRRYLEGLAARRETVLVFEDLHWADEALLAFLEHLAEWSEDVPLLIVCNARPELYERRPGWGAGQRNAHTINLSPLSDEETAELVAALSARALLEPELTEEILERAGGNPLYAEEFVRLVADRGLGAGAVPESVQALIAARLDTLPPERKSLLQDAAVVGKVFWSSAVAEMGNRDRDDVELALHELARKELVRPARTSSMEGETEYVFWHLLVRDVAYSQIPRAERARRHRAAAAWIERKAGERVEDLAEVLAHHYLQTLELAEAAGDAEQAAEAAPSARRFLALAGERALGLDTAQAVGRLTRALELTADDDASRPQLLVRWADAVAQAGRQQDAAAVLDKAIPALRGQGDREAAAAALQIRSRISIRLGEAQHVQLAAEAVTLLEQEDPDPALVAALSQLASANALAGDYRGAIDAANRATMVAAQLGLPEPARAIGYRGYARNYLGDRAGLEEMEHARVLLRDAGAGREVAVVQNNAAIASYPLNGPAASLAAFDDGLAFCQQRGLAEATDALAASRSSLLLELGKTDEAVEEAQRLEVDLEARAIVHDLSEVRAAELFARVARGESGLIAHAEWLIERGRALRSADIKPYALAAAVAALTQEAPARAAALLEELADGRSETPYYSRCLPGLVRNALVIGRIDLARRLADGLQPRYPLDDHALASACAQLVEAEGELGEAGALHTKAAAGWAAFGNVPERAYALLGQGRCLRAAEPLREAHELFTSMGYARALADVDALLAQTSTAVP